MLETNTPHTHLSHTNHVHTHTYIHSTLLIQLQIMPVLIKNKTHLGHIRTLFENSLVFRWHSNTFAVNFNNYFATPAKWRGTLLTRLHLCEHINLCT